MIDISKFKSVRVVENLEENQITSSTIIAAINTSINNALVRKKNDLYIPTPGDNIYILPECNIPRAKIKDYFEDNKIILQKSISKANIFMHNAIHTAERYLKYEYFNSLMPKEDYIKWLSVVYTGEILQNEIREVLFTKSEFILLKNDIINILSGIEKVNFIDDFITVGNPRLIHKCDITVFKEPDIETLFMNGAITSLNCYSQNNILANVNSTIMDEQLYNQVRELCLGKDQANLTVAIEIMANCNYIESGPYLLLLYKEFGYSIDQCKASGHVNFSAFKDFFDVTYRHSMKIDEVIKILLRFGPIQADKMEVIEKYVTREFNENNNCQTFKVEKVVPNFDNLMIGDGDEGLFENIEEEEQEEPF
jgi:hypothetical protein